MQTVDALKSLGSEKYRILITRIPPKPRRDGAEAREMLSDARLPLFTEGIREGVAFQKAALGSVPVNIDATVIALIILSAISILFLIRPDSFSRLKLLEMAGFKLELLEKVREKQEMQQVCLDDIRWILPLLLPETERTIYSILNEEKLKNILGEERYGLNCAAFAQSA